MNLVEIQAKQRELEIRLDKLIKDTARLREEIGKDKYNGTEILKIEIPPSE